MSTDAYKHQKQKKRYQISRKSYAPSKQQSESREDTKETRNESLDFRTIEEENAPKSPKKQTSDIFFAKIDDSQMALGTESSGSSKNSTGQTRRSTNALVRKFPKGYKQYERVEVDKQLMLQSSELVSVQSLSDNFEIHTLHYPWSVIKKYQEVPQEVFHLERRSSVKPRDRDKPATLGTPSSKAKRTKDRDQRKGKHRERKHKQESRVRSTQALREDLGELKPAVALAVTSKQRENKSKNKKYSGVTSEFRKDTWDSPKRVDKKSTGEARRKGQQMRKTQNVRNQEKKDSGDIVQNHQPSLRAVFDNKNDLASNGDLTGQYPITVVQKQQITPQEFGELNEDDSFILDDMNSAGDQDSPKSASKKRKELQLAPSEKVELEQTHKTQKHQKRKKGSSSSSHQIRTNEDSLKKMSKELDKKHTADFESDGKDIGGIARRESGSIVETSTKETSESTSSKKQDKTCTNRFKKCKQINDGEDLEIQPPGQEVVDIRTASLTYENITGAYPLLVVEKQVTPQESADSRDRADGKQNNANRTTVQDLPVEKLESNNDIRLITKHGGSSSKVDETLAPKSSEVETKLAVEKNEKQSEPDDTSVRSNRKIFKKWNLPKLSPRNKPNNSENDFDTVGKLQTDSGIESSTGLMQEKGEQKKIVHHDTNTWRKKQACDNFEKPKKLSLFPRYFSYRQKEKDSESNNVATETSTKKPQGAVEPELSVATIHQLEHEDSDNWPSTMVDALSTPQVTDVEDIFRELRQSRNEIPAYTRARPSNLSIDTIELHKIPESKEGKARDVSAVEAAFTLESTIQEQQDSDLKDHAKHVSPLKKPSEALVKKLRLQYPRTRLQCTRSEQLLKETKSLIQDPKTSQMGTTADNLTTISSKEKSMNAESFGLSDQFLPCQPESADKDKARTQNTADTMENARQFRDINERKEQMLPTYLTKQPNLFNASKDYGTRSAVATDTTKSRSSSKIDESAEQLLPQELAQLSKVSDTGMVQSVGKDVAIDRVLSTDSGVEVEILEKALEKEVKQPLPLEQPKSSFEEIKPNISIETVIPLQITKKQGLEAVKRKSYRTLARIKKAAKEAFDVSKLPSDISPTLSRIGSQPMIQSSPSITKETDAAMARNDSGASTPCVSTNYVEVESGSDLDTHASGENKIQDLIQQVLSSEGPCQSKTKPMKKRASRIHRHMAGQAARLKPKNSRIKAAKLQSIGERQAREGEETIVFTKKGEVEDIKEKQLEDGQSRLFDDDGELVVARELEQSIKKSKRKRNFIFSPHCYNRSKQSGAPIISGTKGTETDDISALNMTEAKKRDICLAKPEISIKPSHSRDCLVDGQAKPRSDFAIVMDSFDEQDGQELIYAKASRSNADRLKMQSADSTVDFILASVIKNTPSTLTGLKLDYNIDGKIIVYAITKGSLFRETPLEAGDEIISVNNVQSKGKTIQEIGNVIREADGDVAILAKRTRSKGGRDDTYWLSTMTLTSSESKDGLKLKTIIQIATWDEELVKHATPRDDDSTWTSSAPSTRFSGTSGGSSLERTNATSTTPKVSSTRLLSSINGDSMCKKSDTKGSSSYSGTNDDSCYDRSMTTASSQLDSSVATESTQSSALMVDSDVEDSLATKSTQLPGTAHTTDTGDQSRLERLQNEMRLLQCGAGFYNAATADKNSLDSESFAISQVSPYY